jgi:uncharacterized protein (TIGR02246 family)
LLDNLELDVVLLQEFAIIEDDSIKNYATEVTVRKNNMNIQIKKIVFTALLFFVVSCSEESIQNIEFSDSRALTLVNNSAESFSSAWATKNSDAMGELYSEDAIRIVSTLHTPVYGREAIASGFTKDFDEEFAMTTIESMATVARFLSPNIVFGTGTFDIKDSTGSTIMQGLWGNAYELQGNKLVMLMESAGASSTNGMNPSSLAIPQITDQTYSGPGSDLVNDGVVAYEVNTNSVNPKGVADLFTENGIMAISANDRAIVGNDNILESITSSAASGITLDAWAYGYREIDESYALGWGGYKQTDSSGSIIEYGQWGNIWEITTDGLKLVIERAGAFSGE